MRELEAFGISRQDLRIGADSERRRPGSHIGVIEFDRSGGAWRLPVPRQLGRAYCADTARGAEKRRQPVADDESGPGRSRKETAANTPQDAHRVGEAALTRILLRVKCSTN